MANKKEFEWDFGPLIGKEGTKSFAKKRKVIEEAHDKFSKKWKGNKEYLEDPEVLKKALDDYEHLKRNYAGASGEGFYYDMMSAVQMDNPEIKSGVNKVTDFIHKLSDKVRFFALSISKIPEKEQKKFLEDENLGEYQHFLERLFAHGKHLLSEKEERILALKEKVANDNWDNLVGEFLSKAERTVEKDGKRIKRNFNELSGDLHTQDYKARKKFSEAFDSIVEENADLAVVELNSILENKKIDDELRGYSRADSARHLGDDVDAKFVDTLIKTVSKNYEISRRFYEFKLKLMKLKKFEYNDRNIEYSHTDKKYDYEESVELVKKTFGNLDKEFLDIFERFMRDKQIDVFPRKGKRGGAFCAHYLVSHPTYILLNHTDTLQDVTTIAHEVGHGINNEFMKKERDALSFGIPKATAEVASTFMEDFVFEELLRDADDEQKFSLMVSKLQDDVQTIFRQVACYMFEQKLHENFRKKGFLSKDDLGKIFEDTMMQYLGEAFLRSDSMKMGWVYWPHIRGPFYVYSYASGLLISKFLQSQVRKDKKFLNKVKTFLSAGTSKSPKEIFLELGIDISKESFWLQGLKEIEELLDETEELGKKLGKI